MEGIWDFFGVAWFCVFLAVWFYQEKVWVDILGMFRACSQGFWSTACHIPFPRFYNFFNYLFVNLLCEY